MSRVLNSNPYLAVRQAFDAPWPGPRGQRIELSNGKLTATIFPEDGCRITSFIAYGLELLRQWNPGRRAFQYGCFPMIPWVGRMRNGMLLFEGKKYPLPVNKPPHALHGMACFGPWKTTAVTGTLAEFEFTLERPWPWNGRATQRIELVDDSLCLTLQIATDETPFPAAAGWHPWFSKWIGDTAYVATAPIDDTTKCLQVIFSADWQEEPGLDELPTGRLVTVGTGPWDDCFGFNNGLHASLSWPGKMQLDITSPASRLVVFDKQPDATCVNPMSGPPDGVNTEPKIVVVNNPLVVSSIWNIASST